jgi:hypothetical protein
VQALGFFGEGIYGVKPMGKILDFPKPNSSSGGESRILGRRADNFKWKWCEPIIVDLRTVNADTAPCEYVAPPDDCA